MLLYLFKSEGIIAALVPVALAVDGMEIEAAGAGGLLPIAALGACDALHVDWSAAGAGVAMPMPIPMAMEMLKAAAKAARGCAAKRHAIGTRSGSEPGAAVDRSCRQRTRDRGEGGAPHQGQHDTARAFHDVSFAEAANVADGRAIRQGEGGDFTTSPWGYNGKVFCMNEEGKTYVIRAGDKYELLDSNDLGEMTLATPALVGDRLILRTENHLYAIRGTR